MVVQHIVPCNKSMCVIKSSWKFVNLLPDTDALGGNYTVAQTWVCLTHFFMQSYIAKLLHHLEAALCVGQSYKKPVDYFHDHSKHKKETRLGTSLHIFLIS